MSMSILNKACISGAGLCTGLLLKDYNLMSQMEMLQMQLARDNIAFEAKAGREGAKANQRAMYQEGESIRCQGTSTLTGAVVQGVGGELGSTLYGKAAERMPGMKDLQTKVQHCESWKIAMDKVREETPETAYIKIGELTSKNMQTVDTCANLKSINMENTPYDDKEHGADLRTNWRNQASGSTKGTFDKVVKQHTTSADRAQKRSESRSSEIQRFEDRIIRVGQTSGNAFSAVSTFNSATAKNNQGKEAALQTLAQSTEGLLRRVVELATKGADNQKSAQQAVMQAFAAIAEANRV